MSSFALPPDYPRVQRVNSFHELVSTPFANGVNALCWQRTLPGDFGEIVKLLGGGEDILVLDDALLLGLPVSVAGRAAVEVLLEDQRLLRDHDLDPVLNCIHGYPRDGKHHLPAQYVHELIVGQTTQPFGDVLPPGRKQIQGLGGERYQSWRRQPDCPFTIIYERVQQHYEGVETLIDRSVIPDDHQLAIGSKRRNVFKLRNQFRRLERNENHR